MKKIFYLASIFALSVFASCGGDDDNNTVVESTAKNNEFTVAFVDDSGDGTPTYVQSFDDLTTGVIDWNGAGFTMPATRSVYLYSINDGKNLVAYDYNGTGNATKYSIDGGVSYSALGAVATSDKMGTTVSGRRFSVVNDNFGTAHYAKAEDQVDDNNIYLGTKSYFDVLSVDLTTMTHNNQYIHLSAIPDVLEVNKSDSRKADDVAGKNAPYVWRVHYPIIHGNYIYYGIARDRRESVGVNEPNWHAPAGMLRVTWPLPTQAEIDANPEKHVVMFESNVATIGGDTYGYRTSPMHIFNNKVYQVCMNDTHILRFDDNGYDNSWSIKLAEAISAFDPNALSNGANTYVTGHGWWLADAEKGIGYVAYEDKDAYNADTTNEFWGIARVDLVNKTVIPLELPKGLDLWQYQSIRVKDGKVYMAMAPKGKDGNIYVFDVANSTNGKPEAVGATLKCYADMFYAGVY